MPTSTAVCGSAWTNFKAHGKDASRHASPASQEPDLIRLKTIINPITYSPAIMQPPRSAHHNPTLQFAIDTTATVQPGRSVALEARLSVFLEALYCQAQRWRPSIDDKLLRGFDFRAKGGEQARCDFGSALCCLWGTEAGDGLGFGIGKA